MTVYHLDGPELMATHFCPQGNQPRLKMMQSTGSRFDFAFHDATGVLPGQGVQRAFWIEIGSDGTLTRSETYVQGEKSETETISYQRLAGQPTHARAVRDPLKLRQRLLVLPPSRQQLRRRAVDQFVGVADGEVVAAFVLV
jgi:hypothetical protein